MLQAADLERFRDQGLWPAAAARAAGVRRQTILNAERRTGVSLTRRLGADLWFVDHREAVQDMKPLAAVEYLLGVLEQIVLPADAATAWDWPGALLTAQEKRLVFALASGGRVPVSRDALWQAMRSGVEWRNAPCDGKTIDVVLMRVRRKLAPAGVQIVNVRCLGWRIEVPPGFVWPWAVPA